MQSGVPLGVIARVRRMRRLAGARLLGVASSAVGRDSVSGHLLH